MSVPNATLLAAIVVAIDTLPFAVCVAVPVTSPVNAKTEFEIVKSIAPSPPSSYAAVRPVCEPFVTICQPTIYCTLSVV